MLIEHFVLFGLEGSMVVGGGYYREIYDASMSLADSTTMLLVTSVLDRSDSTASGDQCCMIGNSLITKCNMCILC